jgi:hypothetical protein
VDRFLFWGARDGACFVWNWLLAETLRGMA